MTKDASDNLALGVNADGFRKKKILFGILTSCALTCLTFFLIEIKHPFFFMTDDNAGWYAGEYANVIRCIFNGKFPLYSFTQLCGQRFFANGQTGVFNPVMYIAALLSNLLFGDYRGIADILALLMMLLGAIGAYLLLERLDVCQGAAIAGAFAWNFNAYNIWVGGSWILVVLSSSVLPFIIYGSLRLCQKPNLRDYLWAIIPKTFLFYISHPQFFFYAALFDFLFVGTYTFLFNKNCRLKSLIKLIGRYVLIYIAVVILVLPQLLPLYQMISSTRQGQTLSFNAFNCESEAFLVGIMWPFFYDEVKTFAIDPYIGYPLALFLFASILIPVILLSSEKKRALENKHLLLSMLSTVPGIIIAFLSNYSMAFKHVLHVIPIVNRFHYLHRNNLYLSALMVIFASLACTFFWRFYRGSRNGKNTKNVLAARIAGTVFVLLEVINMTLLFSCQPRWSRGPIYKAEEGFDRNYAAQFAQGRYICIGYEFVYARDYDKLQDMSHSLRYNIASCYGINNVSGYYGVYTDSNIGANFDFFKNIRLISGDLHEPYPGFIDEMRKQSVSWYILNPENKDRFEGILNEAGINKVSESEYGIIYYDTKCEPLAYDEKGQKIDLAQEIVNDLSLNTDNSFGGGLITINYAYDSNFRCYIDGIEYPIINDNDNWQMKIDCPAGTHNIAIRYVDQTFNVCCIVTGSFLIISLSAYVIFKCLKRRNSVKEKQ